MILARFSNNTDEAQPGVLLNVGPLAEYADHRSSNDKLCVELFGTDAKLYKGNLKANITPKNAFVHMHFDEHPSIDTLVGGAKLWIGFPSEEMRTLLAHQGPNLTRGCFQAMRNGVFMLQEGGDKVSVPAFMPHCTFSLQPSILIGHTLTLNGPCTAVPRLHGGLDALQTIPTKTLQRSDHLQQLCDDVEQALKIPEAANEVIKAWAQNEFSLRVRFQTKLELWKIVRELFRQYLVREKRCHFCARCGLKDKISEHTSHDHIEIHFQMPFDERPNRIRKRGA